MRLDLKTKMRLLLILAPFGVIMLLALTFYIMDQEFRRVAPEEMAARSWLSERGAQITKGGRGRFGLHIIGVDFSNMNLVDGDMWGLSQELASLSELKTLQLSGTRISDQGLKYLCDLSSLESLDLSRTNISDTGLAELTRLPNLGDL